MHAARIACVLLVALSAPALSHAAAEGGFRAEAKVQSQPATKGLAHAGKSRADHRHDVRLQPPEASQQASLGAASKNAPLAIGFGRDVTELATEAAMQSALSWQPLADGSRVAAVTLTSPGAASIRAGVRIQALPPGTTLRFQAPDDDEVYEVGVSEIEAALADARTYWSPLIEGETIVIEVQVPASARTQDVRFAVPRLSHLATSAAKDFALQAKAAASCEVDAMC